ncbi:LysR substrate-binding domain-containing protein [Pseudoalteromonas fenneropenaei]|uniref:LysR substrate-binding domain-containing protein n=1 Tax=Pseudoalteromonas fenneropenaei TaxID=1737459 RepID=A0ABV7CH88_9GAMM
MNLPPLKSLHYFKLAAELGSFKLAAESLYVTQAAVSQQIRLLESQLGVTLFTRQTRKVELTAQGKQLLPFLTSAFLHIQNGIESLSRDPNPNCLTLSVLPSFASCWLLPRVSQFQAAHPDINIRIDPSDAPAKFDEGQIDLGIRFGLGQYPELHSEKLSADCLLLAYKPGILDPSQPLKAQLQKQKLIMDICPDAEQAWRLLFAELNMDEHNLPSNLAIDNAALVVQAALAGQGVAMLRQRLIEPLVALGQLEVLPTFQHQCRYHYYLVGPTNHFNWPKVEIFHRWLVQQFADSPAVGKN